MDLQNILSRGMGNSIPATYLMQASQTQTARNKQFSILIQDKKWPKEGWDDLTIELFLNELATMDSNNFPSRSGVGEREARIYSSLVAKRHFRLCHGIGRSGDLAEVQPKATGSSILSVLTNSLVRDLCRMQVSTKVEDAFLAPMATGMSMSLVLLTLAKLKPQAKYVIWPRIDQKSCFKSILTSGLEPVIIETKLTIDDSLETDVEAIEKTIATLGAEKILCVLTTTSCFAPRKCDSLELVGALCKTFDIYHVINNAYGLQSGKCTYLIQQAAHHGRVDIFVQSTDKNLMVPVGGAIIAGFDKKLVQKIRQNYPGRASSSQMLDVFITMLSMGSNQYNALLKQRRENFFYLKTALENLAKKYDERVVDPQNQISLGMTLSCLTTDSDKATQAKTITELGSMLFLRSVCGARAISSIQDNTVEGFHFKGWGAHHNEYPHPYVTAASSIGMETKDVDLFIEKLDECLTKLKKKLDD